MRREMYFKTRKGCLTFAGVLVILFTILLCAERKSVKRKKKKKSYKQDKSDEINQTE